MLRILVTGALGQIGHELLNTLSPLGEVIGVDAQQFDLTNEAAVSRGIADARPDVVVNTAAYTAVDRAETEPDLARAVNAVAPALIARECARLGAAMVHFSTDYVFNGRGTRPYTPSDAPDPVSVYGRTKLEGDRAVQQSGAAYLILRTAWVYSLRGRNFVLAILRQAESKPELRVVSDQVGCPTWARSAARATAGIIQSGLAGSPGRRHFAGREGIYNVVCAGQTSWFEFAREVVAGARLPNPPAIVPIKTADFTTKAARPAYSVLDCSLTEQTFGVRMQHWREAIQEAMQEYSATSPAA